MFELNFIENKCDEESEGIENESMFLDELFKNECDYLMIRHMSEILILESPLKKRNLI